MKDFSRKIINTISFIAILIFVGLAVFFLLKYNKESEPDITPQVSLVTNSLGVSTNNLAQENEDNDVYRQRQLRADSNNSMDVFRVGGARLVMDSGISVSAKFYKLGSVVENRYGYTDSLPSLTSTGVYVDTVIELENLNKSPISVDIAGIRFVDQAGRIFAPLKKENGCSLQKNEYPTSNENITSNLNPNVPCIVSFLFEVATSSTPQYIEFSAN